MHKHTAEKWWLSGFNSACASFNKIDDNIHHKSILHRKTNLPQQIEASCLQTEQVQLILQVGELFLPTKIE